jgi:hypothetical protein
MIVYKDYLSFQVLGQEINLISDETDYGRNTVAEIAERYYYLGDEYPNVVAAVMLWQEINERDVTPEELHQIMIDNNLPSSFDPLTKSYRS